MKRMWANHHVTFFVNILLIIFMIIAFVVLNNVFRKDNTWNSSDWVNKVFGENSPTDHFIKWKWSGALFLLFSLICSCLMLLGFLIQGLFWYLDSKENGLVNLSFIIFGTIIMIIIVTLLSLNVGGLLNYQNYLDGGVLDLNNPWRFKYNTTAFFQIQAGVYELVTIVLSGLLLISFITYDVYYFFIY